VWFDSLFGALKRNSLLLALVALALAGLAASAATNLGRGTFFVLGFGSFLLESLVLFNSFLLLGDPNLSAALAVGAFLLWGGLGSFLSGRGEGRRWTGAGVAAAIAFYGVTAPFLHAGLLSLSPALRFLIFALHLAPAGIAAGLVFPLALTRFRERPVATLFCMDVIGCALAPPAFWIALSLAGVWPVAAAAVACYAAVGVVLARKAG